MPPPAPVISTRFIMRPSSGRLCSGRHPPRKRWGGQWSCPKAKCPGAPGHSARFARERSLEAAGAAPGGLDDAVEIAPHAVERLGHHLRVAQGLVQQFGALTQHHLRHLERLLRVALLDMLREAILEIRFMRELREMDRERL